MTASTPRSRTSKGRYSAHNPVGSFNAALKERADYYRLGFYGVLRSSYAVIFKIPSETGIREVVAMRKMVLPRKDKKKRKHAKI